MESRARDASAPLFSVVIPLYNRASSVTATINSVLAQTCQDFEIVVVDDGSNDNPEPVIQAMGDIRIRYIRQENGGGGKARNTGIDSARGDYIAFLDSDDFFLPHKLECFKERITNDPQAVGYSYINVDRGVGRYWVRPSRPIREGEDVGEYLFVSNELIQTSTIVVPRELAKRVRFDPSLRKGQDPDFCLRLQRAGARFFMIEEPLIIWTDVQAGGRLSHASGVDQLSDWLDRSSSLLTPKASAGYRVTMMAYYKARTHPFSVAKDLFIGWAVAGVPLKVVLRQVLRSYLPQSTYRAIVDRYVGALGQPPKFPSCK